MHKDIKERSSSKLQILFYSDKEELEPKSKKKDKLDVILNNVSYIKDTLACIISLAESRKLPLGIKHLIKNAFKCIICPYVPI